MNLRAIVIVVSLGGALWIAGCGQKPSPIGGITSEGLPAFPITENPVLEMSDYIAAETTEVAYEFVFHLDTTTLFRENRIDDMRFTYRRGQGALGEVAIHDHAALGWGALELYPLIGGNVCDGWGVWCWSFLLLSGWAEEAVARGIGHDGRLLVRGKRVSWLSGQLIDYHPGYEHMVVRDAVYWKPVLAFSVGKLWVSSYYNFNFSDLKLKGDSTWVLDRDGQRVMSFFHPEERVLAMTGDDAGNFWQLLSGTPRVLIARDSLGAQFASFTIPWRIRGGIAWADGEIWCFNPNEHIRELFAIDIEASIASGSAQIARQVAIALETPVAIDIVDGYGYSLAQDALTRFTLDGEILDIWRLRVTGANDLAWDGEAFWIIHNGAEGASTTTSLLSRFSLPDIHGDFR